MKATAERIDAEPIIRLTMEMTLSEAREMKALFIRHVSFGDFAWAERAYDALNDCTGLADSLTIFANASLPLRSKVRNDTFLERLKNG